jgi:hypothetical protein
MGATLCGNGATGADMVAGDDENIQKINKLTTNTAIKMPSGETLAVY